MTPTELRNKVENLDWWLTHNHNHPDYNAILADKKELERQLAELEHEKPG